MSCFIQLKEQELNLLHFGGRGKPPNWGEASAMLSVAGARTGVAVSQEPADCPYTELVASNIGRGSWRHSFFFFPPTAESFGVSAQIGSGVVQHSPEVRFYEGSTRVPHAVGDIT